jgi:hypothetical protein
MLIYLDLIANKKLKAPSTDDAVTPIYADSNASIKTAGGLSVEKRIMAGQFYGRVPLGGVIPIISTYTGSNNTGSASDLSGLVPASGEVTEDGFMRCNGVLINNPLSPFNSRYTPNISDDRFIQGSNNTFATVENLSNVNRGNNFIRLTDQELPNHNHDISHGHGNTGGGGSGGDAVTALGVISFYPHGFTGYVTPGGIATDGTSFPSQGQSAGYGFPDAGFNRTLGFTGGIVAPPFTWKDTSGFNVQDWLQNDQNRSGTMITVKSATVGGSHTHSVIPHSGGSGSAGNNTPFDIRPKYISGIYLMRII